MAKLTFILSGIHFCLARVEVEFVARSVCLQLSPYKAITFAVGWKLGGDSLENKSCSGWLWRAMCLKVLSFIAVKKPIPQHPSLPTNVSSGCNIGRYIFFRSVRSGSRISKAPLEGSCCICKSSTSVPPPRPSTKIYKIKIKIKEHADIQTDAHHRIAV